MNVKVCLGHNVLSFLFILNATTRAEKILFSIRKQNLKEMYNFMYAFKISQLLFMILSRTLIYFYTWFQTYHEGPGQILGILLKRFKTL